MVVVVAKFLSDVDLGTVIKVFDALEKFLLQLPRVQIESTTVFDSMSGPPNPLQLLSGSGKKAELPNVEQLGTIDLPTLNQYHCNNPTRRLISVFGTLYDVTLAESSYGAEGSYKEYAGHDMTLAISKSKLDSKWLDRFVNMREEWVESAKGWAQYYDAKYPVAGKLDKWEEEMSTWDEMPADEVEEFEQGCTIM